MGTPGEAARAGGPNNGLSRHGRELYRVALADDNKDVLQEIRRLLASEFEIACAVHEAESLLASVQQCKPDAVVCDLSMPGLNGIEAGRRLIEEGWCGAVVMLTMYNEAHWIQRALEAGIRGFVLKVDAGEELIAAVRAVIDGRRYLSRGVPEV